MKTIKKLLIAIAASASVLSCDSFFDVNFDDQATMEGIFAQTSEVRRYLAQCYSYIPMDEEIVGSNGWVVARSDEALYSWYQWVFYLDFRSGNYGPSYAASHFDYWSTFYIAINQCSIFMQNAQAAIDKKKESGTSGKIEAEINEYTQMIAEARFLRAYYYFCLFRQYGPVFIWGDQQSDESIKGTDVDRHTVDQNVNFIVEQLDIAMENLPIKQETAFTGRATKAAAMAVKARTLLYAASKLYNGCDLYVGQMKNIWGDYLFPQTPDPNKWETAAQAYKDIIDLDQFSLCKVEDADNDDFTNAIRSVQAVQFNPWNEETIWGWWYRTSSGYSWMGSSGAVIACQIPGGPGELVGFANGNGGVAPSLKLVDTYPMAQSGRFPVKGYKKVGGMNDFSQPEIDPLSGYQVDGWVENYQQPDAPWAPTFKAHASTVGRDARFYANIVPNGFYFPCQSIAKRFTTYNGSTALVPWSSSDECLRVGYMWRKNYKTDEVLNTMDKLKALKYVYPAFTLAEVYLSYAECCNEKPNRNEADALYYLNLVRERAGLNKVEEAYPEVSGNQELLRWIIQRERMVELAFMAQRHYDACRWMIAKDEYPAENWTLNLKADNLEDTYERVSNLFPTDPMRFDDRDYLFPMSSTRLSEIVNITQNYGF